MTEKKLENKEPEKITKLAVGKPGGAALDGIEYIT